METFGRSSSWYLDFELKIYLVASGTSIVTPWSVHGGSVASGERFERLLPPPKLLCVSPLAFLPSERRRGSPVANAGVKAMIGIRNIQTSVVRMIEFENRLLELIVICNQEKTRKPLSVGTGHEMDSVILPKTRFDGRLDKVEG